MHSLFFKIRSRKSPPPNRLSPIHPRQPGDRCAARKSLQFGFSCPSLNRVPTRTSALPGYLSSAGGGGHALRVAGGGLIQGRRRGLPLQDASI